MIGDQRLVARLHHGELEAEAFGIVEPQSAGLAVGHHAFAREALLPEGDRILRGDPPHDAMHHAGAGAARMGPRILEERQVGAGASALIRVEEVVHGGVVLVDGLLHEAQAQDARVEVDVTRRVTGDAGDVMDTFELHPAPFVASPYP